MTGEAFANVNGERVTRARVHVPPVGPWFADVDFELAPALSGRVTLRLGALELVGTIDPRADGTRGMQRRCRIVAGAGAWGAALAPKAYHNDQGVKARLVAEDAAREAGETLAAFAPATERVGTYYTRRGGAASRALEDAAAGAAWWVAYDGRTHVGERLSSTPADDAYQVLDYDPQTRVVTLGVDDLTAIQIGATLSESLDEPQTVRELEIDVTPEAVRVLAWCGGAEASRGRLPDALRAIVEHVAGERLFGVYRYRVIRMAGDNERLELQAARRVVGLPDVLPIAMWPGVAGAHAEPALGAEVLVQFVEGDRTQPIVTGFAGKAGPGFTPVTQLFDATTEIVLGEGATSFVALKSDLETLKTAIANGVVVAQDGGESLQSTILAALASWPVSSTKVKAR
jgi:hypothetical protein